MLKLLKVTWLLTAVSAGILIIVNLLFVTQGFYFTGDTIFYTNYSFSSNPGDILTVFIKHSELWPPLISIIFNLLHVFPISIMAQHKIYVFLVAIAAIIVSLLISRKLTHKKGEILIITALCLFSGSQALLFKSAIAEPLLVFLWIITSYWLFEFLSSKRSFFLFLFIFCASLIPLARYAGIGVLFGFYVLFGVFYFLRHKSEKYVVYILTSVIVLSLIPIGFYLFKNLITSGVIARSGDVQTLRGSILFFLLNINRAFLKDMSVPLLLAFFAGFKLDWDRKKILILITMITTLLGYQSFLVLSSMKYNIIENFPSRFISPTYPIILLGVIIGGTYLAHTFSTFKRISVITPFILIYFFGYQIYLTSHQIIYEANSKYSDIEEPKYSGTIKKLCNLYPDKQRYIYNLANYKWIALSLNYYCLPATIIPPDRDDFELDKGKILYTSYILDDPTLKDVTPDESIESKLFYDTGDTNGNHMIKVYLVEDKTIIKTQKPSP